MRTACVFCGLALTAETRAPQPSPFTRSGVVKSRRSWCRACDTPGAATRARRLLALEAERRRDRRAYLAEYRTRPEVVQRKRELRARAAWRQGRTSFRCAGCAGRFPRAREAWRLVDGRRERLGLCAYCARERVGASRHEARYEPRVGRVAYMRAWRARQREKGKAATHPATSSPACGPS